MNCSIRRGGGGELVYFGATTLQWCWSGRLWSYKTPSNINEPSHWVVIGGKSSIYTDGGKAQFPRADGVRTFLIHTHNFYYNKCNYKYIWHVNETCQKHNELHLAKYFQHTLWLYSLVWHSHRWCKLILLNVCKLCFVVVVVLLFITTCSALFLVS